MTSKQIFCLSIWCVLAPMGSTLAANMIASDLQPNDLIITEYLANPVGVSDAAGEYFEIYNTTNSTIDLAGIVVRDDGSNQFTLDSLIIAPGSFAVLSNGDGNELGFGSDLIYGTGMTLTNTADEIALFKPDDTLIHKAVYDDGDFFGAGVAYELAIADLMTPSITLGPSSGGDFVAATNPLGNNNFGSPGLAGNTQIDLPVVPLPPAVWLFGGALSALSVTRRSLSNAGHSSRRLKH